MGTTAGFAGGLLSLNKGIQDSAAIRAQAEHQKQIAEINAKDAESQAKDAAKRGAKKASRRRQQGRQEAGDQKAALAAAGADVRGEIAQNVLQETEATAEADILAIKTNAWREAWGFKSEAVNQRFQGQVSGISARFRSRGSLISGGQGFIVGGLKGVEASRKP